MGMAWWLNGGEEEENGSPESFFFPSKINTHTHHTHVNIKQGSRKEGEEKKMSSPRRRKEYGGAGVSSSEKVAGVGRRLARFCTGKYYRKRRG